jgi:hypothetical protein
VIEKQKNNIILKIAIFVAIISYSFWNLINEYLGVTIFYVGIALSHFLLALYIKQTSKLNFLIFFLFCVSLNNLLDELVFDPKKIGWNEYLASAIIIVVYLLKDKDPKSDA